MIGQNRVKLRVEDVRRAVQVAMRLRRDELISASCNRRVAQPRQIIMALAHELGCASSTKIGLLFRRDYTTVLHARRRVAERESTSAAYKQDLDQLRLSLLVYKAQIKQADWPWPNYPELPGITRRHRAPAFMRDPAPAEAFVIGTPMPSAFARAA